MYNSTLKKQKSKFLSLKTVPFYSCCVSFYTPLAESYQISLLPCADVPEEEKKEKGI